MQVLDVNIQSGMTLREQDYLTRKYLPFSYQNIFSIETIAF